MKVLFLEVDTERTWAVASLGPGFLAAYLRAHGHQAEMIRIAADVPIDEAVAEVRRRAPGLIGISLTTRQWLGGRRVVNGVREVLDIPVVAGGLHPTFSAEDVLSEPGFDYVCLGEGEEAMLDLVAALAAGRSDPIANIWPKGGARPALRPPFEPIDDLPFMTRDLLDEHHGVVHMTTQRGCPFACTYCAARMYDELYANEGKYGRRRSHQNVLAELDHIRTHGDLNYVIFLDDTFTINHPWVYDFCRLYRAAGGVPFSIHARVETMKPKLIDALAEAGCLHVTYGVESGSERMRRQVMQRPVTNARMIEVFRRTREAGIIVTANYMMGIPGETRDDMQQTLDLHDQLRPADFGYFVFYPYPGTRLFHVCRKAGYLPDNYLDLPANNRRSILDLPEISKDDIAEYYDKWTAIRAADAIARSGGDPAEVGEMVTASAALG